MNQHPAYELFEELGRGANTVVYRSYDLSLGREVAIKELDENSRRDPRQREQFLREAQFLAQFEHDNVLRVYSVDPDRGWIVLELMKGTLASVIAAGPSDPDLVRSVLKQTLEALTFLHEKHKVHGTVRPSNLLINDAGRVKLSEFEQATGGELRAPKGSKKYLAPELIKPEFGDFGPPLDLYCLAFTALELLKGTQFESLFPGTGKGAIDADLAWLRWHSSAEELPATKKLVKHLPDDLAHVLDGMLQKRVADRPQSAQEVLRELADRPLVAVPVEGLDDAVAIDESVRPLAPGVVRTIAAPQPLTPRGATPARFTDPTPVQPTASGKPAPRGPKSANAAGKPLPPRFGRAWLNQQLGRPYVLYPLCALILVGAVWASFGNPFADATPVAVKQEQPKPAPAKPVELPVVAPAPATFVDISIHVTPATAELKVDGTKHPLTAGSYTHKLQSGQSLTLEASLARYESMAHTFTADDLKQLNHKVILQLERAKPRLPAALVEKPGATLDDDLQLPTRVLAARLGHAEPLELALVKPGTYQFGAPAKNRRPGELSQRSVRVEQPYYVALHEITNAQYQKFHETAGDAKAGTRWLAASRKWAGPQKVAPVKNQLPVTNVSLDEAQAFCAWLGAQLPTEIEWECAVRGRNDQGFPLPWGDAEPGRDRCRIFTGEHLEHGEGGPVPVQQLTAGANRLGLLHAIGNAAEWCRDSDDRGGFILRGCSIATANVDDVRVTWRARGDARGDESTGFRVVVPMPAAASGTAVAQTTFNAPVTPPIDPAEAPHANSLNNPPATTSLLLTVPWTNLFDSIKHRAQLPYSTASASAPRSE